MKIVWRKSAISSLLALDRWRKKIELPPIAPYLKETIDYYFIQQDFTIYLPGRHVLIKKMPVDLRMVLISIGKSDPYKVFYRIRMNQVEVFLVRHPHQQSLE
jgi:hypothetical protein